MGALRKMNEDVRPYVNTQVDPTKQLPFSLENLLLEDQTPQVVAEVKQEFPKALLVTIGCILTVILTLICF